MKQVKLGDISKYISEHINVSDKFICELIGITPASLSSQKQEPISENARNKVCRRLMNLYIVTHYFAQHGLDSGVILSCVRTPSYQDLQDNFYSVSTAIQQDKYDPETLLEIGKLAYEDFQQNMEAKDDLFPYVKNVLAKAI